MGNIDKGARIGIGLNAIAFKGPSGLDIQGNLGNIKPMLRRARQISFAARFDDLTESPTELQRTREGRIADEARILTHLLWERDQGQHFAPDSSLNTIQGVEVTGEEIFNNSSHAVITQSALHGGIVLSEARQPLVESSVLTGGVVLGGAHGSNTTEFDSHALALILDVVEGIHGEDGSRVQTRLLRLKEEILDSYDALYYGSFYDDRDNDYTRYGDLAQMAIVFDYRYLPILQSGETNNVTVRDSILISNGEVGMQILGGTVTESAIEADQAFTHAHVVLENTYLLTRDGESYIEKGHYGDPILARDLVAAVATLPDRPLATVVQ